MKNRTLQLCLALGMTLIASGAALAQEADSLDAKVNAIFASATGPFVDFIFMSLPGTEFSMDCSVAGSRSNNLHGLLCPRAAALVRPRHFTCQR